MVERTDLWTEIVRLKAEDLHREADGYRMRRRGISPRRPRPSSGESIER